MNAISPSLRAAHTAHVHAVRNAEQTVPPASFSHLATMDDAGLRYRRIYAELEMNRNDILGSRRGHPDNPYYLTIADRYRAELAAVEAQMELRL